MGIIGDLVRIIALMYGNKRIMGINLGIIASGLLTEIHIKTGPKNPNNIDINMKNINRCKHIYTFSPVWSWTQLARGSAVYPYLQRQKKHWFPSTCMQSHKCVHYSSDQTILGI